MKTEEELNVLKAEVETVSKKLRELSEDELAQVIGGDWPCDNSYLVTDENNLPDYEIYVF